MRGLMIYLLRVLSELKCVEYVKLVLVFMQYDDDVWSTANPSEC